MNTDEIKLAGYWEFRGRNGQEELFRLTVAADDLKRDGVYLLLQVLAARHLSPEELIGAHCRARSPRHNGLLEVKEDQGSASARLLLMCGENPHYTAQWLPSPR